MAPKQDHLKFWKTFAQKARELPVHAALRETGPAMKGTPFEPVVASLLTALESGKSLGAALEEHPDLFSRAVVAMAMAGEASGALSTVAERIVASVEDSSFLVPGIKPAPSTAMMRFWRSFARLISSGVPILYALEVIGREVGDSELEKAAIAIRQALENGRSMAQAMRAYPELFSDRACDAVAEGEQTGCLDDMALSIANALESGQWGPLGLPRLEDLPRTRAFVNALFITAFEARADHIHMDPTEDGKGRFRLRVDGVLHDLNIPASVQAPREAPYQEVVNRIKLMAGLDIAQRRLPQDGRIVLSITGHSVDVRTSTVPTVHGERVAMAILRREEAKFDLHDFGIVEPDLARIRALCHVNYGLVLCAGPTGSGKTTLLYAMLNEVDRSRYCVVSVEDPVEYYLEGVAQINLNPRIGLTFAQAVRHVLRQDPDVILIGEIRDTEVANLAAQCALTGHLVLTTLNAETAPGGIRRLVDMGLEPFVANASLGGSISQRLIRTLCAECKKVAKPPRHSLPPEAVELMDRIDNATFYVATGCTACHKTGYRGRTAIHEVLIPDDQVRELVAAGASTERIRKAAIAAGMRTMLACGIEKAARGITTVEEVLRVVPLRPDK